MLSPTLSLLDFFVRLPLIIFFLLLIFTCCTSILPSQVLPASCTGLPPSWVLLTSRTSHSLECPPASRTSLPTSQVPPPLASCTNLPISCISHKSPNLLSSLLHLAQVSYPLESPPLYLAQISYPLILYFSLMLLCVIYQCIGHSSYPF